ncbi:MAG: ATP-binding protein [Candidatus Woesearchaeota archaeon]|nr:ATP-binding protein [Candidatus Woesearchaeota archaeon]
MHKKELDFILEQGEGYTIEFKEKFTPKIDEDMVAFANTKGGIILLGVKDNRQIIGETLTNELKAKINTLARNCKPSLDISFYQTESIVIIKVPEGTSKPYSCGNGYYRRLDGTTQKMHHEEIKVLFNQYAPPFEEFINKEVSWKEIAKEKILLYLKEINVSIKNRSAQDILASLECSKENEIKNVGVLFFAKEPTHYIRQCRMTLVAFKGTERTIIFDRVDVDDDLLTQFNQAIFFIKKHLNIRSEIRGVNRYDIYEIPIDALREAVVNAIVHRDYSVSGTSIMVEVYDDRISIVNPGGLAKGLSKKTLGTLSIRRNPIIADLFFRMGKMERMGTGIKRMKEAMKKEKLPSPQIEVDTFFKITFLRTENRGGKLVEKVGEGVGEGVGEKLTLNQEGILNQILQNKQISAIELSSLIGISQRKIEENIKKLKAKGLLKRIGPDKGGHWEITKK